MDTYQCRVCGGPLTAQEDAATAVCEYCGSVLRIPRIDPAVYNHALELRRQKKYDQAAALFRQCIRACPQDAEAHWNLLLCKFGIEYVRERDGSRVPTCNALIYDPITEDEDYLDALRFADDMSARLYIDEAQRYLQAWREAYGAACYETLQKLLSGEERYSHRMRKEIEAEYGHVTQYAPPAVRTKAQKAYRIWEQQIPQWEAFCRDTQSADKVFADLRAAHPSLDEAVRKLEAGNKKYRRLNGKALPVGFSTIPTLLYLALAPLLLTIFGPDCLGKDLLGVFSMGSVILLGAYAVGFLAVSFMHNEENSFANCHLLNGGIMGLSVAVGLVLSLFNQIFFRLLASIYEVELVMTKFGEIADGSMVTLLGEFRGFTAVFVKVVVLLTAMAAAGAVVCHGRQRKVESLRKEREKLLLTAQAETRRRVADFCQPYIQAFEYPVAEIFGLRRRVLDYFTRTYARK